MTHLAEIRVPEPQNNSKNNGTNFLSVQTHVMSFLINRHFGINNYLTRKTHDNLVALHRFKKLSFRTFAITLRFKEVEARNL